MKKNQNKTVLHGTKTWECLFVIMLALIFITGCTPKDVDPLTLPVMEKDLETAPFPPETEELTITPRLLLPLVVFKDQTVTDTRLNQTIGFINSTFEEYGNFSVIPQNKVKELLSSEENQRFQASNIADAIQLGSSLNASFVGQLQVMISEAQVVDNIDHFKSNVNLTIFTTDSGQVVFKKDIQYDTLDPEASKLNLKKLVQEGFPLRGFILETRGERQYAKISMGKSLGIKIGREFQVRERVVKNEVVMGLTRKTISFSNLSLATLPVIEVMEDESWLRIDAKFRDMVKKGHVVFSKPEKGRIFP
jgi:hypothetical protein